MVHRIPVDLFPFFAGAWQRLPKLIVLSSASVSYYCLKVLDAGLGLKAVQFRLAPLSFMLFFFFRFIEWFKKSNIYSDKDVRGNSSNCFWEKKKVWTSSNDQLVSQTLAESMPEWILAVLQTNMCPTSYKQVPVSAMDKTKLQLCMQCYGNNWNGSSSTVVISCAACRRCLFECCYFHAR